VFRDPADPDPARRYKLFTADLPVPVTKQTPEKGPLGIDVATSPDGIHWTPAPGNPVLAGFNSDTAQCAFRDPGSGRFVAFVRVRDGSGQRSVGRTESPDFTTWSEPRLVYAPTPEDRARNGQFYSLSVTPYEGLYIGLVWIFPATPASADWKADAPVTWPELVVSHDTVHWQRVAFGEPFLANGPAGSFDHRQIRTASSLVALEDRILLLYAGSPDPHVAAHHYDIGMATLRRDGFAAMVAGDQEGTLRSKPLRLPSGRLHVNAAIEPGGVLTVGLLDAAGEPLTGFGETECLPCTGDALDARIAWRNQERLPAAPEDGLRLSFRFRRAKLYAFWFDAVP